jgi:hypothetical protein
LFGNITNDKDKYPSRSQQPSFQEKQQLFQEQQDDAIEKDVSDYTNSLRRTVTAIKEITISIRDELGTQNESLSGISNNMTETQNSLKNTVKRLNNVVQSKTGRNTLYIVLGTLSILFILYYFVPYAFNGLLGSSTETSPVDEAIVTQTNMS